METAALTQSSSDRKNFIEQELKIVRSLGKSKYTIYLTREVKTNKYYAMKIFPYKNDQIDNSYLNECSFCSLNHPNIITYFQGKSKYHGKTSDNRFAMSYILMELAPYGDFHYLIFNHKLPKNETLSRTFFHQLVAGVEYIHSKGIAHLDLKPNNLLLGAMYTLKIIDFELAIVLPMKKNKAIRAGTQNYRAPELRDGKCKLPLKADIFSLGIILFNLKYRIPPYIENDKEGGDCFYLLHEQPELFWAKLEEKYDIERDEDFSQLFMSMVVKEPEKRATIEDIKKSAWYNRSIYSQTDLYKLLSKEILPIERTLEESNFLYNDL